jgi:hypothetical protein
MFLQCFKTKSDSLLFRKMIWNGISHVFYLAKRANSDRRAICFLLFCISWNKFVNNTWKPWFQVHLRTVHCSVYKAKTISANDIAFQTYPSTFRMVYREYILLSGPWHWQTCCRHNKEGPKCRRWRANDRAW